MDRRSDGSGDVPRPEVTASDRAYVNCQGSQPPGPKPSNGLPSAASAATAPSARKKESSRRAGQDAVSVARLGF